MSVITADVAVIGAGPAGLTAAACLAADGLNVLVLEREAAAGGIPRHSDHLGYGIRDMRTFSLRAEPMPASSSTERLPQAPTSAPGPW